MASALASFQVAPAFKAAALRTAKSSTSHTSASRQRGVVVKALKQNARVLHDAYNEHHGPEYYKFAGLDVTPDERVRRRQYYDKRTETVRHHFRNAIGIDDWLFRVESKLNEFGFTGDNTIAMTSLCRDEITAALKNGIHEIFGYAMDIDGLAGYCSAGVTGLGAGMSHSPTEEGSGKERYVFIAMPHIAVVRKATGLFGAIGHRFRRRSARHPFAPSRRVCFPVETPARAHRGPLTADLDVFPTNSPTNSSLCARRASAPTRRIPPAPPGTAFARVAPDAPTRAAP